MRVREKITMNERDIDVKDPVTGTVYQETLSAMKRILDLGEFKIGAANSKDFAFFKREVMDSIYSSLRNAFKEMEREGVVRECPYCNSDLRKGWEPCTCRGSGYISCE